MLGTMTYYSEYGLDREQEGIALYRASLELYREAGDKIGISNVLNNLGEVARLRGDYAEATRLYQESLTPCRELDDLLGTAIGLINLGYIALHDGKYEHAESLFSESLKLCRHLGGKKTIALALGGLASSAGGRGEWTRAARLFGAAEALLKAAVMPLAPADAVEYDRHMEMVRAAVPEAVWNASFTEGSVMPTEQAIMCALQPWADSLSKCRWTYPAPTCFLFSRRGCPRFRFCPAGDIPYFTNCLHNIFIIPSQFLFILVSDRENAKSRRQVQICRRRKNKMDQNQRLETGSRAGAGRAGALRSPRWGTGPRQQSG